MATKPKAAEVAVQTPVASTGIILSQETPEWAKSKEGRGSEEVGLKDMVLPRLEIIQSQSPIKDSNPDAEEGLLFNTVTGEVLGDEVIIVPLYFRVEWLVWKDQDFGGGFFGAHDTEAQAQARLLEVVAGGEQRDHMEIVDTPVHYCLRIKEGGATEQIVISMPKSKAKVSRKWNATINLCGGDRFSRAYKVTTFKDKNKQNKTFFNYIVQPAGFPPESIYREAEKVYLAIRANGVATDHQSGGRSDSEPDAGGANTDPI